MAILDKQADNRFNTLEALVEAKFGGTIRFNHAAHGSWLSATIGLGGGKNRCFNAGQRTWDVMEDDDVHVSISHNGMVFVNYSLEDQADCGMTFKLKHPQEISELLHLLVNPKEYLAAGDECSYRDFVLGDIAELVVLIPDGSGWRLLDPSALQANTPDEFRRAIHSNLTRNREHFHSGATCEAVRFAEKWPDIVSSLPDASQWLRRGYILDPDGDMKPAVDLAVTPPADSKTFADLLIIPARDKVSSLYLREYVNGDRDAGKKIRKAFTSAGGSLDAFIASFKKTAVRLPGKYQDQVRIGVEHNAIQQWLMYISERVALQRGCFYTRGEQHWHLAHTLSQMLKKAGD